MRITIILLMAALLCAATTQAQKAPSAVTAEFSKSYPEIKKVKWDDEDGKYEASFIKDRTEMSVLYNTDGTVVETEMEIPIGKLPLKAIEYAKAKGTIKEASKIVLADGTIQYEAEVKKEDFLFDSDGNLMKMGD